MNCEAEQLMTTESPLELLRRIRDELQKDSDIMATVPGDTVQKTGTDYGPDFWSGIDYAIRHLDREIERLSVAL